jgi:hypothetical protein
MLFSKFWDVLYSLSASDLLDIALNGKYAEEIFFSAIVAYTRFSCIETSIFSVKT